MGPQRCVTESVTGGAELFSAGILVNKAIFCNTVLRIIISHLVLIADDAASLQGD